MDLWVTEPESKPKTSIFNLQPDEISSRLKNMNGFHFDDQVWKIQECMIVTEQSTRQRGSGDQWA